MTRKTTATATSATPQAPSELEQFLALKQKLQQYGSQQVAEKIEQVKQLLRELVTLSKDLNIYVDFEEIQVEGSGLYWNSSSMNC